MKLIAQGAEAKLYRDRDVLLKDRIKKSYRISQIDDRLRGSRTRREGKVLSKLEEINFSSPRVVYLKGTKLKMDFISGDKLATVLEKRKYLSISREIGRKLAILHNHNIIHGDLTTSNLILGKEVTFIDFGLSYFSRRIEDKAVDLHLFRQALESKHHTIWEKCFKGFIKEYVKNATDGKEILLKFNEVESRGRHKRK